MPRYEELNSDERYLASLLRFTPEKYLSMKKKLVTLSDKYGGIRLSHARSACKVNVNSVKPVYFYLLRTGIIKQLPNDVQIDLPFK